MKFGVVPVSKAQGAILAHSVKTKAGRLRKGCSLTAEDIDALTQAGLSEVTVAQLMPDDIHENEAARRIADAISEQTPHVTCTTASTGRVNILASQPGLARVDAEAIHALNSIDPMVTCATVLPLQRMAPGGMIATVKIISYGVAARQVDQAERIGRAALGLHPVKMATASLIVTETGAEPDMEKGINATRMRLAALGMSLEKVCVVPHTVPALSAALYQMTTDINLILTASATSDPLDTGPQALLVAGGQVTRFGMPVDPGNLLFYGELSGRPVIGLPGCARAPALNGADWVLERIACGLAVEGCDIAAMGVGGLLKEIPQRPHPRRGPA